MLDDYFSLEIDAFGQLCTLPMVLDDHVPSFSALPIYIMRLATEVTWTDEEECLDTFCRETARFYAVQANDPGARYDAKQHEEDDDDDEEKSEAWKSTIEHVIYANAKKHLLYPPKARAEDMTFVQVANLPDLYKVFERC
jgi:DNA mismatch repair protein MLH1